MKKNYNPKKLNKKQKHMKKWIPDWVYCEGGCEAKHNKSCPFYRIVWSDTHEFNSEMDYELYDNPREMKAYVKKCRTKPYKHKREECAFSDVCDLNCEDCTETVSYCEFLKYKEYGDYPLGDMCKICGIHMSGYYGKKNKKHNRE